jgi:hypothetical protein
MYKLLRYIIIFLWLVISIILSACAESYENPPPEITETDLIGSWEVNYSENRTERIILNSDGTYIQIYNNTQNNYQYESNGNKWWLEHFPDGNVYIHLEYGRYYLAGERIAELNGRKDSCPLDFPNCHWETEPRIFYDPYVKDTVEMVDELLLTIRIDQSENIFLHHMWTSSDRGFAIIGGQSELFRMVDGINP